MSFVVVLGRASPNKGDTRIPAEIQNWLDSSAATTDVKANDYSS